MSFPKRTKQHIVETASWQILKAKLPSHWIPEAKAKEVVEALGENSIKVTEGLVYSVKGGMKEKKARKKRVVKAAKAAASTASSNGMVSKTDALTMIREVKSLALKAGGYDKLKELVDALAE